ncbi:TPA: SHOCT domain-containing protein [Clostridioides difficile]|nr:SHOCT domain-containing protein [Clostridioides difficile]
MGLFGKSEICVICGEEQSCRLKIKDGYVCKKCVDKCGIGLVTLGKKNKEITKEDVVNVIEKNENRAKEVESFNATKKIGTYLEIDESQRKFLIPNKFGKLAQEVLLFDDVIDYELLEDGETLIKGGLGRALTGGILFGGVGAVVVGVTGKKETKAIINSLKIKITLNNLNMPAIYIDLINSATKKTSFIYKTNYNIAQEILSTFSVIQNGNQKDLGKQIDDTVQQNNDPLEQIRTLKELLDIQAITEEEFNAKKKELLNL